MEDWDVYFMGLARQVAAPSKDPSTKVGAIIVRPNRTIASTGYNGFPRGVHDLVERYENREEKYLFVAHAERNALDSRESSVHGCTIYSTLFPCNDCMKGIIQCGIVRVVAPQLNEGYVQWADRFRVSLIMAGEAGVALHYVEG